MLKVIKYFLYLSHYCYLNIKVRGQKLIKHSGGIRIFLYRISSVAVEQQNLA